jgi:hypothetical protein
VIAQALTNKTTAIIHCQSAIAITSIEFKNTTFFWFKTSGHSGTQHSACTITELASLLLLPLQLSQPGRRKCLLQLLGDAPSLAAVSSRGIWAHERPLRAALCSAALYPGQLPL